MSKIRHTLVGICIASASLSLMAQTADEHKAHHPAGSTLPASTQMKAAAKPTGAGQMAGMAKMDEHMKAMQAMHEKMMAAKTPEERQALMDEHMKLMQDGTRTRYSPVPSPTSIQRSRLKLAPCPCGSN